MRTVLSTKILALAQKERLLNAGLGFVEYNAINIAFSDFEIDDGYDNYIFTSQNAVKSYTKKENSERNGEINAFSVGKKTADLLKQHGFSVVETTDNATALAQIISKDYSDCRFLFLSGNKRRDELPELLKKNNVRYKEVVVYETYLVPKRFDRTFDGVLFFSPSGIQSFTKQNKLGESIAFCIGETTANEAKKHTENIITATRPTVENVLVKAIKYFNGK
ncbi:uroporphyrinogen-III synthase [Allomuricauda sp. SCSIO 65647]|uniref:uroporphyrinogen-III synthase n=1 Tax=Allomuricauda sp. SCSIO 65647 TaxID=2908843 RepID=UPI001F327162|nr:uroporphyrinogen-III synthase [Muricauda sp. SCSIO 65647]UJH68940.1 uroporphyrinogen-III synthase [Muricauda sp. SCSIO 65647]